jgi:hypothetical protein
MASGKWWVINQISRPGGPRGPQQTNYVVVQNATRPVNAVAGPFGTQAQATAWQTSGNTAGNSPGSAVGGATNAALKSLNPLAGLFQANIWIRVGEVALGLILIAVGIARLTNAVPIATKIAGVAAKGALL